MEKTIEIDGKKVKLKNVSKIIIDNKNFFEITAKVSEQLQILYALNGILNKAENLMNDCLYNHSKLAMPELKITYIR